MADFEIPSDQAGFNYEDLAAALAATGQGAKPPMTPQQALHAALTGGAPAAYNPAHDESYAAPTYTAADLQFPYPSLQDALIDTDNQARVAMHGPYQGNLANMRAENDRSLDTEIAHDNDRAEKASGEVRDIILGLTPAAPFIAAKDTYHAAENKDWLGVGLGALGSLPLAHGIAGIMAGPLSKTANIVKMKQAAAMATEGRTADEIWHQTGWFKDLDGAWKYEIPDNKLALSRIRQNDPIPAGNTNPALERAYFSGYTHPELKRAYDPKETIYGAFDKEGSAYSSSPVAYGGSYNEPIPRSTPLIEKGAITVGGHSEQDARTILAHELDHAVQYREGFGTGGSPKSFTAAEVKAEQQRRFDEMLQRPDVVKNSYPGWHTDVGLTPEKYTPEDQTRLMLYRVLKGETSARNVERRLDWTPEMRQAYGPWATEDVYPHLQISKFRQKSGQYQHPEFTGKGDPNPFYGLDPSINPPRIDPRYYEGYLGPPSQGHIQPPELKLAQMLADIVKGSK